MPLHADPRLLYSFYGKNAGIVNNTKGKIRGYEKTNREKSLVPIMFSRPAKYQYQIFLSQKAPPEAHCFVSVRFGGSMSKRFDGTPYGALNRRIPWQCGAATG